MQGLSNDELTVIERRLNLQEERPIVGDEDEEPEGVDGDDEEDGEVEDEGGEGEGETGGGDGVRPFLAHSKVLVLIFFFFQTLTHLLLEDVRICPDCSRLKLC